jgi:hypothetical protein
MRCRGSPAPPAARVTISTAAQRARPATLQERKVAPSEDAGADRGLCLHPFEFVRCQSARLEQDAVRDADLAHVVEGSGLAEEQEFLRGHAQRGADPGRQAADSPCVLTGVVVAILGRDRQPLDYLELRVVQ